MFRSSPSRAAPSRSWIASGCYLAGIAAITVVAASGLDGWALAGFVTLGLAVGVAAAFRRRWPLLLVVVAGIATLTSTQIFLVPAMFNLGVRKRNRWDYGLLAGCVVLLAIVANRDERLVSLDGLDPETWTPLASWVLNVIAVVLVPFASGLAGAARRDLVDSLRARAVHAEAERAARAAEAVLLERARIASEAHDVLGHKLSLLTMQAGGLEVNAGAGQDVVAHQAHLIRTSARAALDDLRSIIGSLESPHEIEVSPLERTVAPQDLTSLRHLANESIKSGAVVRLHLPESVAIEKFSPEVIRATYRIVQEGLTNAHKHAFEAPVIISVDGDSQDGLLVEVKNATTRASKHQPGALTSGRGIPGLRERVRIVGGELSIDDSRSVFVLSARLPWVLADPERKAAQL